MPDTVSADAWRQLMACCGLTALLQMDGTMVVVALPTVERSFGVNPQASAWLITAYFLTYAAGLVPGGRLVDRVGTRTAALLGLALFGAGALVGAVSEQFGLLVASRVLQGLGAGLASPAALAGAVSGFPASRRGTPLGIWGAVAGIANVIGPLLGGLLTAGFGWRANWWALVPLAAAAALAVVLAMRAGERQDEPAGQRLARLSVAVPVAAATLTFTVMIGSFFLIEQYLQDEVGYSALLAAAAPAVVAVFIGAAGPVAGRLTDARGERLPAIMGFALAGVALGGYGLTGAPLHGPAALPLGVLLGLGLGLLFAPVSRAALNAVPQQSHGQASALISSGRLAGAAFGAILAGAAVRAGTDADQVHTALLWAAGLFLVLGVPLATKLGEPARDPAGP
jgi:MFS family permease